MARRPWNISVRTEARDLIAEANGLLTGHSALAYAAAGRRSPAWSLVGVLAHRNPVQLRRFADDAAMSPGVWMAVLGQLATSILAIAPTTAKLMALQRETLIPLELELLGRSRTMVWTPDEFAEMILHALDAGRPSS